MPISEGLRVLENKHCMDILLALKDGPHTRTELYEMVSRNPRMPDKISDLMGIGLITIVKTDRRADSISLTEKGSTVAEHLGMIDGTIESRGYQSLNDW